MADVLEVKIVDCANTACDARCDYGDVVVYYDLRVGSYDDKFDSCGCGGGHDYYYRDSLDTYRRSGWVCRECGQMNLADQGSAVDSLTYHGFKCVVDGLIYEDESEARECC